MESGKIINYVYYELGKSLLIVAGVISALLFMGILLQEMKWSIYLVSISLVFALIFISGVFFKLNTYYRKPGEENIEIVGAVILNYSPFELGKGHINIASVILGSIIEYTFLKGSDTDPVVCTITMLAVIFMYVRGLQLIKQSTKNGYRVRT